MLSAFLETIGIVDALATALRWLADGLGWITSSKRRKEINARWASRGTPYRYLQVLFWLFVLVIILAGAIFFWAAFTLR